MKYKALLTQHGEDNPTASVLENELSETPVWTRKQAGIYIISLADAFPDETKIFGLRSFDFAPSGSGSDTIRLRLQWNDEDENLGDSLLLDVFNVTQGQYQDGLLANTPIGFDVFE